MTTELVEFWREFSGRESDNLHPRDRIFEFENGRKSKGTKFADSELLHHGATDFREYVSGSDFGREEDYRFHVNLLPSPYTGNLETADIFVLLLNPGLNHGDYLAETESNFDLRPELMKTIHQEFTGEEEFPFIWLNPKFCWHPGFIWWEAKLRKVANRISEKNECSYSCALSRLSKRLASIELIPYHSARYKCNLPLHELPSAKCAQEHLTRVILPRVDRKEAIVIATRRISAWNLKKKKPKGVITYQGGETRASSLGPSTRGGKAILEKFGIKIRRP